MKKKRLSFLKKTGLLIGIAISSTFLVNTVSAAEFTPLDTVGKGPIDISYLVDDTKNITNYAGVSKAQVCVDCREKLNLTYSMLTNGQYVTNTSGTIVQRVNKGALAYFDFEVASSIKDGKHWLCLQTEDDTAKTINGNFQKGNLSEVKDNVSCKRFYYDIEGPKMTDIVVNKNNRYTNKSDIPVTMTITDNYAGIREITYDNGYGSRSKIPASDISCTRNTTAGQNEGKWTCKVDTVINVNSDRAEANIVFNAVDNVSNSANSPVQNIRFDKIIPTGTLQIHEDGEGVVNSQIGYVEYHVKDPTGNPWIYPSGLVKVSVSEMDGSHEEVLLDDPDLTKDKQTSLDGMLTDYLLTTCNQGAMSLKLYVKDRAGNYTGDGVHNEVIISNSVVCSEAKVSRFDVTDVINPAVYTESIPFQTLSWLFNDGATAEGMENGILAPVLAGANTSFEFDVEWTGDIDAVATAAYTVYVKNPTEGYEKSFTGTLNGTSFVLNSNGKKYSTFKDTITIPKDAPSSANKTNTFIGNGDTAVSIKVNVTITSVEGGKNKVTKSSALFEKSGNEAVWGKVVGSIDDYLWFGETN